MRSRKRRVASLSDALAPKQPPAALIADEAAAPIVAADTDAADTTDIDAAVAATADAIEDASERSADFAEAVAAQTSDTISRVTTATADAFAEARSRLQTMTPPVLAGDGLPDPFKTGADFFKVPLESNYARASQSLTAFNAKAMAAWRTNAETALAHWRELTGVKSLSEAIALQSAFARKQIEAFNAQSRELAEIAGRMTRGDAEPGQG